MDLWTFVEKTIPKYSQAAIIIIIIRAYVKCVVVVCVF